VTVAGIELFDPAAGRACSSYLVEFPRDAIVADLGTGRFSNLLRTARSIDIDAVVISHMHADHFIDVVPMRYALKYGDARARSKPLYLPPGGERCCAP
jgi:ribonuclease BN (tRNA processing enzyme)